MIETEVYGPKEHLARRLARKSVSEYSAIAKESKLRAAYEAAAAISLIAKQEYIQAVSRAFKMFSHMLHAKNCERIKNSISDPLDRSVTTRPIIQI